jgi:glycosyltransferase involved in cell wall biosynthesis
MATSLDIITITKDDKEGLLATIASTRRLRSLLGVKQIIIDSSIEVTRDEIQALLSGEESIEYFWQPPAGISAAFNLGIDKSKGDWIWFLNGRDELHSNLEPNLFLKIISASKADMLVFELEFMQSGLRYPHPTIAALWPPIYGNWVPHPATLLRRELFEKYGGFDLNLKIAMDLDLWMRLFTKNIVIDMLSIPIVLFDQNGMSSDKNHAKREERKIIKRYFWILMRMWVSRGRHLFNALRN